MNIQYKGINTGSMTDAVLQTNSDNQCSDIGFLLQINELHDDQLTPHDNFRSDTICGVTMSAIMELQGVLQTLQQRKTNLCCKEIKDLLESLGFEVRDGKAGHKLFFHQGLPSFFSGSFNCGHGKNPEIKPAYIAKIINTIKQHETELKEYLEKQP